MNSALRTSAQETSAALARNLTGAIRDRAIHQHAVDAHRNRLRSLERCDVLDVGRVENDEVGEGTLADFAAILELEVSRGEAAHLVHGGLEREQSQLAAVMTQHTRERSP